nr:recombinase family protein [Klebsiella pneumoniae]
MQYAYIRVSSADQNTARQEEALSKAGFQPDKICVEHASAKDTNRPGLQELLGQLRPGDTLLVHSIDRLGVSLDIENYCTLRLFFDLSTLAGLSRRNLPEAGIRLLFQI